MLDAQVLQVQVGQVPFVVVSSAVDSNCFLYNFVYYSFCSFPSFRKAHFRESWGTPTKNGICYKAAPENSFRASRGNRPEHARSLSLRSRNWSILMSSFGQITALRKMWYAPSVFISKAQKARIIVSYTTVRLDKSIIFLHTHYCIPSPVV